MKILRISDKIKVKFDGVEVVISPLTHAQKMEISESLKLKAGQETIDYQRTSMLTLKYAIKEIYGLLTYDDEPYELEFDDIGLTEECISELMTALASTPIFIAINSALANVLDTKIEGVEVEVLPKK
jgi:hypothetical protein